MKTLILGLDALDPMFFENLVEKGKLPNLEKFLSVGGYTRFQVANPPQSEVSWTSIATGLDPGSHGMFDFVHRDPTNYALQVSLLPTGRGMGGLQFVRPYNTRTIFDMAADQGYSSTSLWWPATFPARPESPVRTLPGLGTPDIQGRLGVGTAFSSDNQLPAKIGKTPLRNLKSSGVDRFAGKFEGPTQKSGQGVKHAELDFEVIVRDECSVELKIDQQVIRLNLGHWSQIIAIHFKLGWLVSVYAITRLVLTQVKPVLKIYALPLQLHPIHPLWRYGTPPSFVKDAWGNCGPFLTLGWPQDTTGLEDACITDQQFLTLCNSIDDARMKLLFHHLNHFQEGLLASVFDSLDRVQHMFWRNHPEVISEWYQRLDSLVGKVVEKLSSNALRDTRLLIVSDHGFKNLHTKVHLNRWLIDQGYLSPQTPKLEGEFNQVDWSKTSAYAIGLNSLYLNLAGRERQGQVSKDKKRQLLEKIRNELLSWRSEDGQAVIQNIWRNDQVFNGPLAEHGPDLLIGYTPGFRASAETGLGGWKSTSLEINSDHWEADHCFDSAAVPGVLFANRELSNYSAVSFRDIPGLAIDAAPDSSGSIPPPKLSAEDQEKVEERLRSLGYL